MKPMHRHPGLCGSDVLTRRRTTWRRLRASALGLALAAALLPGLAAPALAQDRPLWVKQLGTAEDDRAWAVATDGDDNVIAAGITGGSLGGAHRGSADAWVAKYNGRGRVLWKQQPGTSESDYARGVATDARGNVIIAGWTLGSLGGPSNGDVDAWVAKYDAGGRLKWKRQLGTSGYETAQAVATGPSGNVVITGAVGLAKYDGDGDLLWWQPQTGGVAVAVDDRGNIVTAGQISGSGVFDASVVKYDAGGRLKWTQKLGTGKRDVAKGVAVDRNGNIIVAGDTDGALGGPFGGYGDAWVAKYDAQGHLLWLRQFGTGEWEAAYGVAVDGSGKIFVSGTATSGGIGLEVAWLNKYDVDGTPLWSRQLDSGTDQYWYSTGVATDGSGHVYIGGYTDSLGWPDPREIDAFVAKYSAD